MTDSHFIPWNEFPLTNSYLDQLIALRPIIDWFGIRQYHSWFLDYINQSPDGTDIVLFCLQQAGENSFLELKDYFENHNTYFEKENLIHQFAQSIPFMLCEVFGRENVFTNRTTQNNPVAFPAPEEIAWAGTYTQHFIRLSKR